MEICHPLDSTARPGSGSAKPKRCHFEHKLNWVLCSPGAPICANGKIPPTSLRAPAPGGGRFRVEIGAALVSGPVARAPHLPAQKVFFGAIDAIIELQKIYRCAGWFRIKGYLEQDYGANLSPSTLKVWPTERLPRKGWNKSLAAISNTSYNLNSVTYEKQNLQPGMDPPDPSVAAPPDHPARPHLAQAPEARRRGDQEFGLRPTLQREDARRFPVA